MLNIMHVDECSKPGNTLVENKMRSALEMKGNKRKEKETWHLARIGIETIEQQQAAVMIQLKE